MVNSFTPFIINFFEMLIDYVTLTYLSPRRKSAEITLLIGFFLFESGAFVNLLFSNTIWINSIYILFITVAFALICFKLKFRAAAIYAVLMSVLLAATEFITIFVVSALTDKGLTDYNSNQSLLLIEVTISKSLYLSACILLVHFLKFKMIEKFPRNFFIYPISTLIALISLWYICENESLLYSSQILLSVISLVLLSSTLALFIVYRHNVERESKTIRIKSENERLKTEKTYYDILERQNQQLMIYAHDTKKHLAAIQSLNTDPEISEYISKLSDELASYTNNCHSGNKTLDIMINKYSTECEMRGISFEYDVKACNLREVEDIDLVAILGNIMDNALTASEKSSEKKISLDTTWRNSYSVIIVTNSCDNEPNSFDRQLITTKENQKLHGYGLKSVAKTLKKYNGDFNWKYEAENKIFIATVMIGEKE